MAKWHRHSLEFKRQAVERMKACTSVEALARELGVQRQLLYAWKWQFEGQPEPRQTKSGWAPLGPEAEIRRLKEALADKALEVDFFKDALRRVEQERQKETAGGGSASTPRSKRGPSGKAN